MDLVLHQLALADGILAWAEDQLDVVDYLGAAEVSELEQQLRLQQRAIWAQPLRGFS